MIGLVNVALYFKEKLYKGSSPSSEMWTMNKPRILFVCTANAARSQMAEAYLRAKYGDKYEVFSAGFRPAGRVIPVRLR